MKNIISHLHTLGQKAFEYAKSLHHKPLEPDILALWHLFTQNRGDLKLYFQRPALKRAYLAYYFPLYASKTALLLHQLEKEGHFPKKPQKILDLGCGPLTGTFGAHMAFGAPTDVMGVDQSTNVAKTGLNFLKSLWQEEIAMPKSFLESANLLGPFTRLIPPFVPDLIILAHTFNELQTHRHEDKLRLIEQLVRLLPKEGRLLIIEPANRLGASPLMRLRDELFARQIPVLAPCTGAEKCPLLLNRLGWCHSQLSWQRPDFIQKLDQATGLDHTFLKSSYLLIGNPAKNAPSYRLVSDFIPRGSYVCTKEGLKVLNSKAMSGFRGALLDNQEISPDSQLKPFKQRETSWQKKAIRPRSLPPTNSKKPAKRGK